MQLNILLKKIYLTKIEDSRLISWKKDKNC